MANVLVLAADLPFFPGKMGLDFFQLRHLARAHHVAIVGPSYAHLPEEGVRNLRKSVQECFFWPEPLASEATRPPRLPTPLARLARPLLPWLLRLRGFTTRDRDELNQLAIIANCAPYLLHALGRRRWDLLLVLQSDVAPWLDFLPPQVPLAVYFHDLRCRYLERRAAFESRPRRYRALARRALACERRLGHEAELLLFVSNAEREAAQELLRPIAASAVAPIAIDVEYLTGGTPAPRADPGPPAVLFTGHLHHPPNVDALRFFVSRVWPELRRRVPQASLRVVGCFPSTEVVALCRQPGVELFADVPDVRPFFRQAGAFVVPMRFGGGVRQKVIEAWAMGVPVVATAMAVEGLEFSGAVPCLLADDPAGFAAHLQFALAGGTEVRDMVQAGRRAAASYSSERSCAVFEQQLLTAPARRGGKQLRVALDIGGVPKQDRLEAVALARALRERETELELRLVAPSGALGGWRAERLDGVRAVPSEPTARGRDLDLRLLALLTGDPRPMVRLGWLRRLGADIVHRFAARGEPALDSLPIVFHVMSAKCAEREGDVWREQAHRAERVLFPTQTLRERLLSQWGLDPDRAGVAPTWSLCGWSSAAERRERTRRPVVVAGADQLRLCAAAWAARLPVIAVGELPFELEGAVLRASADEQAALADALAVESAQRRELIAAGEARLLELRERAVVETLAAYRESRLGSALPARAEAPAIAGASNRAPGRHDH